MIDSVLSKIIGTGKETKASLTSIDNTLQKMLLADKKSAKLEEKRNKREEQENKRKSGDKTLKRKASKAGSTNVKDGKDNKIDEKALGEALSNALKTAGVLGAGAALIPGAGAIAAAMAGLPALTRSITGLEDLIGNRRGTATVGEGENARQINRTDLGNKLTNMRAVRDSGTFGGEKLTEEENETLHKNITLLESISNRMGQTKSLNDQLYRANEKIKTKEKGTPEFDKLTEEISELNTNLEQSKIIQKGLIKESNLDPELVRRETLKPRDVLSWIPWAVSDTDKEEIEKLKAAGQWTPTKDQIVQGFATGGTPYTVPGHSTGDNHYGLVEENSFILNRNAAGYQNGGIPVALESGERVYGPGQWGMKEVMLNNAFPRFQEGGEVGPKKHPDLVKLSDENIKKADAAPGLCVTGTLNTMQNSGVSNPPATGEDKGNNPRGGAVQLIRSFGWGSIPGGEPITLESPYGTANANVMTSSQWDTSVTQGKVPSGSLIFQTKHDDWNGTSPRSSGYDMAIAQDSGRSLWNGQPHGSHVYGNLKKVIALTPGGEGAGVPGAPGAPGAPAAPGPEPEKQHSFIQKMAGLGGGVGKFMSDYLGEFEKQLGNKGFGGVMSAIFGNKDDKNSSNNNTPPPPTPGGDSAIPGASTGSKNEKAVLDAIAHAEGTYNQPNHGYNTHFAFDQTEDLSAHPAIVKSSSGHDSDAFGRYQFMSPTWAGIGGAVKPHDGKSHKTGMDMSPKNQDEGALKLVKRRGVDVNDGLSNSEILKLGGEWASVKGGGYGQDKYDEKAFKSLFVKYGGNPDGPSKEISQKPEPPTPGFQNGGVVNMKGSPNGPNISGKSESQFIEKLSSAMSPVVIPVPSGGGGGGNQSGSGGQSSPAIPSLSANPSNTVALDLSYRLSVGAAFS